MGNRAIITTSPYKTSNVGIYVHWSGGQESVEAFLDVARDLGVRDPVSDPDYAMARLCQIIGNFYGGNLSLGIGRVSNLDPGDNGVFTVGQDWKLIPGKTLYAAKLAPLNVNQAHHKAGVYKQAMGANRAIFEGAES